MPRTSLEAGKVGLLIRRCIYRFWPPARRLYEQRMQNRVQNHDQSQFLQLPTELLLAIAQYLKPHDLITSRRTCYELSATWTISVTDLKPRQLKAFQQVLHRSEYIRHLELERTNLNSRKKCCSACTQVHDGQYFEQDQRLLNGRESQCKGSQNVVAMCQHHAYRLKALLDAHKRNARDFRLRASTFTCRHYCAGYLKVQREGFCLYDSIEYGMVQDIISFTGVLSWRRYELLQPSDRPLCPHLQYSQFLRHINRVADNFAQRYDGKIFARVHWDCTLRYWFEREFDVIVLKTARPFPCDAGDALPTVTHREWLGSSVSPETLRATYNDLRLCAD